MEFFENIIITQKSVFILLGFIILLLGTVVNFSFSGFFAKNSFKFSNIILILTLISASVCQIPFIAGFLNPSGLESVSFFAQKITLSGLNCFLCGIADLTVLCAFLVSYHYLKKLRHKAYYFNSLFLCSALALNLLIMSDDFLTFIISLEILGICSLFMIWGYKNKKILYSALKYFLFSFAATSFMILGYALSNGFSADNSMLLVISKIIFTSGLLLKGGVFFLFAQQRQGIYQYNYPSFVFLNSIIILGYGIAIFKISQSIYQIGSLAQFLFIGLFALSLLVCALKTIRAKSFWNFVFRINCFNYCYIALLFFILTPDTQSAGIFSLINVLIAIFAILSAGAILDINKKDALTTESFRGICHKNILFCTLFSTALFIMAGILPSGIMTSKLLGIIGLAKTGLWSTVIILFIVIGCVILIGAIINFANIMYQRPLSLCELKKSELKKRTKLNYFILFVFVIISILLCFLSAFWIDLITNLLLR